MTWPTLYKQPSSPLPLGDIARVIRSSTSTTSGTIPDIDDNPLLIAGLPRVRRASHPEVRRTSQHWVAAAPNAQSSQTRPAPSKPSPGSPLSPCPRNPLSCRTGARKHHGAPRCRLTLRVGGGPVLVRTPQCRTRKSSRRPPWGGGQCLTRRAHPRSSSNCRLAPKGPLTGAWLRVPLGGPRAGPARPSRDTLRGTFLKSVPRKRRIPASCHCLTSRMEAGLPGVPAGAPPMPASGF